MVDTVQDLAAEMLRIVYSKLDDIQSEMRLRFTGLEGAAAVLGKRLVSAFA